MTIRRTMAPAVSKFIQATASAIIFACTAVPWTSRASLSDNAGNYSAWGSSAGSASQSAGSGSTGISGWTFSNTAGGNSSQNGSFLGGSAQVGQSQNINSSSGNAWGLYANSSQTADATATFSSGNLQAGQQLSVQMQNNYIQNGGTVGLSLRNSSGQNVLEFYFIGGQNNYYINRWSSASSGGQSATSVAYTSSPLTLDFNVNSGNGWSLAIYEGGALQQTLNSSTYGTLWSGIDQIRFFDANGGSGSANNVYFNNLTVVPEPLALPLCIFCGVLASVATARRLMFRKPGSAI